MMKYLLKFILFAYFIVAFVNSSVSPTRGNEAKKASQCNVNNCNSFYAGANCKEIKQQLAEILEEIRALKGNKTGGPVGKGLKKYFALKIDFFSIVIPQYTGCIQFA